MKAKNSKNTNSSCRSVVLLVYHQFISNFIITLIIKSVPFADGKYSVHMKSKFSCLDKMVSNKFSYLYEPPVLNRLQETMTDKHQPIQWTLLKSAPNAEKIRRKAIDNHPEC